MNRQTFPDLLSEVRAFRAQYPEVRYVDLISLDIPGHFYGKRYPVDMLEKVAAGSPLKLPQNCVLLGVQGGLHPIGDYCFNDGDPDAPRRLVPGSLKPVRWENQPLGQMLTLGAAIEVGDVHQRGRLLLDRANQARVRMTEQVDRDPGGEIEISLPILTDQMAVLAAHRPEAAAGIDWHERGDRHR